MKEMLQLLEGLGDRGCSSDGSSPVDLQGMRVLRAQVQALMQVG